MMRAPGWWTRSAVTGLAEVVPALRCAILERFFASDTAGQFLDVRWNIVEHPMNPGSPRSIGIICDQSKTFRSGRGIFPTQRNRHIRSVTCVFLRNWAVLCERGTYQLKCHGTDAPFKTSPEISVATVPA